MQLTALERRKMTLTEEVEDLLLVQRRVKYLRFYYDEVIDCSATFAYE